MRNKILGYIGAFGPVIVLCFLIGELIMAGASESQMIWLMLWQPIGIALNTVLKEFIAEDRPNGSRHVNFIEEAIDSGSKGMPSGHAQMVASEVTLAFLADTKPVIKAVSLLQAVITLWQRWSYKKHTIGQLVVGALVGTIYTMSFWFWYLSIKST
jgi:membrane-associated phospholipid phosphatase